jgi:hypothetical protein
MANEALHGCQRQQDAQQPDRGNAERQPERHP